MAKRKATDEIADQLMSNRDVAEYFDIAPSGVRSLLQRYGLREVRGWARADVEAIERLGQGARTDRRRKYSPPAERKS